MDGIWRDRYEGPFGPMPVRDAADLSRVVAARLTVEHENATPGFSSVVACMTWRDDGTVLFEGLTGEQVLTPSGEADPAARVVAHWEGFAGAQRRRHEAETFVRRLSRFKSSHTFRGTLFLVRGWGDLVEFLGSRRDLSFGEHGGGAVSNFARLRFLPDGGAVLESRDDTEQAPADLSPETLAERWTAFCGRCEARRHAA